jgi:hypothetical protein
VLGEVLVLLQGQTLLRELGPQALLALLAKVP